MIGPRDGSTNLGWKRISAGGFIMELGSHWIVAGWIALHIVAMASAICTRIATQSWLEHTAQLGFFLAMGAIGLVTWLGPQATIDWTWSAMTLMAMVLTAVIDFRRVSEPAHAGADR
jgi:hypothetical protein